MKQESKSNPKNFTSSPDTNEQYGWLNEIRKKFLVTIIFGLLLGLVGFALGELSFPKLIATQPVVVDRFHRVEMDLSDTTAIHDGSISSRSESTNYRNGTVSIEPTGLSRWVYNGAFFIIFFALGLVSTEYVLEKNSPIFKQFEKRLDNFEILFKTRMDDIKRRLDKTIELSAFYTDGQELETNAIGILRSKKGGVVWIAAKFISRQLTKSFSVLKFDINGNEYSEFSEDLYRECENFIYLTSPFTPAEWFRQLYSSKAERIIKEIQDSTDPEEVEILLPSHIQALVDSKATVKRIIIIPKGGLDSIMAQEKLLRKFLQMSGKIDNRFIEKEELSAHYKFTEDIDYDFSMNDYAIFEKELLFKWERPFGDEKKSLKLIDLMSTAPIQGREHYKDIVENIFEYKNAVFKTCQDMLKEIDERKIKLKQQVIKTKELPHKLAYFTTGASAWLAISSDPSYGLGKRELNILQQFILKAFSQERTPWNIFHIGPGNGKEIPDVVNTLSPELIRNYVLLDISPELLNSAENIGRTKCPGVKFITEICDIIESNVGEVKKKHSLKNEKNLFLLVANGAILSNPSVLSNIKKSMGKEDRLVITLSTNDDKNTIMEELRIDSVFNLLVEPLKILDINNVQLEQLNYKYEENESMINVWFDFKKWQTENPDANKGHENFPDLIKIFTTLRPKVEDFKKLLNSNGFKFEESDLIYFKDEMCVAVKCKT